MSEPKRGRAAPASTSLALALLLAGLLGTGPAAATDITWFGGTGDWLLDANWLPVAVPGSGDVAVVNQGKATLGADTVIDGLRFNGGTLAGNGGLTITGSASWLGGTQQGTGSMSVGDMLTISGSGVKFLDGSRRLQTQGTTHWTGNNAVNGNEIELNGFSGTSVIANAGTWLDENGFDTAIVNHQGYVGRFVNQAGAGYVKSGASTTTIANAFDNAGSVDVQAGALVLSEGGNSSGSFHIAEGATLVLGNTFTKHLLDQVSFSGTGTLRIESSGGNAGPSNTNTLLSGVSSHAGLLQVAGLFGVAGSFSAQRYEQTSGVVNGAGTLHILGDASWTGGTMQDGGITTVDGTLTISGSGVKFLDGSRRLQTQGTTHWTGNTAVNGNEIELNGFSGTSVIANAGTWLDENGFDTRMATHQGYQGRFENLAGASYVKSGAGTTSIDNPFINTGRVDVQAGTLVLAAGSTNAGTMNAADGATLQFLGQQIGNAGSLSGAGRILLPAGATLTSTGHIAPGGAASTSAGLARAERAAQAGPAAAPDIGTLTIAANLVLAGSSVLDLDLASPASFDRLQVDGSLAPGGVLHLVNAGYAPVLGDSFVVASAAGGLARTTFESLSWSGFAAGTSFALSAEADAIRVTVDGVAAVPEPEVALLLPAGLGLLAAARRRRRHQPLR